MPGQNNGRNSSIPRGYRPEDTDARKGWVKDFSGVELDDTLKDDVEDLRGIIENHVGFLNMPMAVVGPLLLDGTYAKGEFFVHILHLEGTQAMTINPCMYAS